MGRIDTLLAAMTLEEKIGQLTMAASFRAITGPGERRDVTEGVRAGRVGALLNLWGAEETRAVQRLAVEESRLGIPLLLGLDVLHGHHTIFPVPLAEACLFDPALWEKTARAAAEEATMDGVAMTFAPMLDVARDPRWGRIVEGPGEDPWVASEFAAAKTRGFQGHKRQEAGDMAGAWDCYRAVLRVAVDVRAVGTLDQRHRVNVILAVGCSNGSRPGAADPKTTHSAAQDRP